MRYIKLIFLSIAFFFLVLLSISFFIPSEVRVSRAVNLKPGSEMVLTKINDLSQWPGWYPGMDSAQLQVQETQNGKAVRARANGIQIQLVQANDSIAEVEFLKGSRPVKAGWRLIKYPQSDSITLQSYMDFHFRWYPWEKLTSLVMDKTYGPVMELGLRNLKKSY